MTRHTLSLVVLLFGIGIAHQVSALSCAKFPHEHRVQASKNVLIAEIVSHTGKRGQFGQYRLKILKLLKTNGLFKAKQTHFTMPDNNGWGQFGYKPGQILLLYFGDRIFIKCNYPEVIK